MSKPLIARYGKGKSHWFRKLALDVDRRYRAPACNFEDMHALSVLTDATATECKRCLKLIAKQDGGGGG